MITVKPITDQRLPMVTLAERLLWADLPINRFANEQARRNKKIKV